MRLGHIDGLRGLAASAVVIQHALENIGAAPPVNLGRFGVLLFFLISGYVIPPTVEKDGFVRRRAARLLPALWVSVGVYALFLGSVDPIALLLNMGMVAWPFGVEYAGLYWTLTYELGFYVLCLVLARLGWLRDYRLITALAVCCALWGVLIQDEKIAFPAFLLTGMVLQSGNRKLSAVCLLALAFAGVELWHKSLPMMAAMLLPLPVFIATIRFKPPTPNWLLYLGAISYSLYLFQVVALDAFVPKFLGVLYPPAVFALAVAIAATVYRYVERPFMALGKRAVPAA